MDPSVATLIVAGINMGVDFIIAWMQQNGKTTISLEDLQALTTDQLLAAKGVVLPETLDDEP